MNGELLDELIKMHIKNISLMSKFAETFSIYGEEAIMFCIYSEDKPVFAGDLKEKAGLTSGRIATILKQLESKNYIIRSQDSEDKRKTLVRLTDTGRIVIEKELNEMKEYHGKLLEYLGDDSAEFIRIIKRIMLYIFDNGEYFP